MATDFAPFDVLLRGQQHSNPMFDYMTSFIPRKLKSFFLYCEYLYHYSGSVMAVVNKLAYYPVTVLRFDTDNADEKKRHEKLHEEILDTRKHLIQAGINKKIYGNDFISIHFPFHRLLECPECRAKYNPRKLADSEFEYEWKTVEFKAKCICGYEGVLKVEDETIDDKSRIHIIHWDPKHIDIQDNPITGEAEYYYEIPGELAKRVQEGDKFLIKTLPMSFLKAIALAEGKKNKVLYKFEPNMIYHLRETAPAGIDKCWGFPAVLAGIKGFFHMATLRKANEAIAMDFVVPMRVASPKQSTASADPTQKLSLSTWVDQMESAFKQWRRDPLYIMMSPIPVDVTHVGGQGRALMVTGEITQTENEILASMGVPREFIYGGLTSTGGGVTLRMIENQLLGDAKDLIKLAQWLDDRCAEKLTMGKIKLSLEKPKLLDDVEQKMLTLKANEALGGQLLSLEAVADLLDVNLQKEQAKQRQETINNARTQMELENELATLRLNLSQQANQAAQGVGLNYDPQAVIAQAQSVAQQFMQVPDNTRRSHLDQLNKEDPVMYAVVIQQIEALKNQQRAEADAMLQQQQGQGGM